MKVSTLSTLIGIGLFSAPVLAFDKSNTVPVSVLLATSYEEGIEVDKYWVSEKLDGIRAYWTGSELLTRKGHKIMAPDWFIAPLPKHAIDGELWAGRGGFQQVASTVLDSQPDDELWAEITFMMFDMPHSIGMFPQRYSDLSLLVQGLATPHLKLVEHHPISSEDDLLKSLEEMAVNKGEGLMLRKLDSIYRAGRSDDLIKLKKHYDDEAIIVGYTDGKGKFEGMVGALILQMPNGQEFKIGSGLSNEVRENPPILGQQVTYRYNGFTDSGIPKFARYIAVREKY
ncbi:MULTISPECIES: DNA ligase [Aliivibrio]|uniref:DNA ligase n=1 Tax=Aliivibrio TaxID=511678 RepID=UPI0003A53BFC|nr:DNA ligase [Aliivibrio logei]